MRALAVLLSTFLILTGLAAAPAMADPGTVAKFEFVPNIINGGESTTGTLTLAAVATDDTVVTLVNFSFGLLIAPETVTIPAGTLSVSFTATARPLTDNANWACLQVAPQSVGACVWINPVGGPVMAGVTLTPILIAGGDPGFGTVVYRSQTGGITVSLASSNPAVVSVPAQMTVPSGSQSASFPYDTFKVNAPTQVTVTASALGQTQSRTMTVSPQPDSPFADKVTITRAEWRRGLLRIEATSTNPNAILTVFFVSAPDEAVFNLTNRGGGRYSTERGWIGNPLPIIVRSNWGGFDRSDA
jgi:hypothetical protein